MITSCPLCSATAPSLSALHKEYASKGLTVIGMYHHKEDAPLKPGEYAAFANAYGFEFPVARDPDWTTLKAWWLTGHDRDYSDHTPGSRRVETRKPLHVRLPIYRSIIIRGYDVI